MNELYNFSLKAKQMYCVKKAVKRKMKGDVISFSKYEKGNNTKYINQYKQITEREQALYSKLDILLPITETGAEDSMSDKVINCAFDKYEIWLIEKALLLKKAKHEHELEVDMKRHPNMVDIMYHRLALVEETYDIFNSTLPLEARKKGK